MEMRERPRRAISVIRTTVRTRKGWNRNKAICTTASLIPRENLERPWRAFISELGSGRRPTLTLMQILLVQRMDFPGQIWPVQASTQPLSNFTFGNLNFGGLIYPQGFSGLPLAPLFDQLEFPTEEVIQQSHVRLYQDREPSRTNNQVRVHERYSKMLHHVGDLCSICEPEGSQRTRSNIPLP